MKNNITHAHITVAEFNALLQAEHPFATQLGMEVLDIGPGTATLSLPDNPAHTRLGGVVAGPMLMGLADMALYAAVMAATGNPAAVTTSLSINFMRGAPSGGILAYATILKAGRITSGEVRLCAAATGDTVAQAISTWALPSRTKA